MLITVIDLVLRGIDQLSSSILKLASKGKQLATPSAQNRKSPDRGQTGQIWCKAFWLVPNLCPLPRHHRLQRCSISGFPPNLMPMLDIFEEVLPTNLSAHNISASNSGMFRKKKSSFLRSGGSTPSRKMCGRCLEDISNVQVVANVC